MFSITSKGGIVVLHHMPDVDAIVGAWLYTRFCKEINNFLFWSGGPETLPQGEGFIAIDIGGGKFDHHPPQKFPGECAATLVAKKIEIDKDPALQEILEYTVKNDLQGIRSLLDFADFTRCINQQYPEDPERTLKIGFEILDALYDYFQSEIQETQQDRDRTATFVNNWLKDKDEQVAQQIVRFVKGISNGNRKPLNLTVIFTALLKKDPERAEILGRQLVEAKYFSQQIFFNGKKELKDKGTVITVVRDRKIMLNVVTIQSDNPQIAGLARHEKNGFNAALVIQQNSNGRTLIFTNNRFSTANDLTNITAMIRLEEQLCKSSDYPTLSFERLTQPGHTSNWYYQKEDNPGGGKLLNGSLTSPDIEPTVIPLERIQAIVLKALQLGKNFRWNTWVSKVIASREAPL